MNNKAKQLGISQEAVERVTWTNPSDFSSVVYTAAQIKGKYGQMSESLDSTMERIERLRAARDELVGLIAQTVANSLNAMEEEAARFDPNQPLSELTITERRECLFFVRNEG